MKKSFLDYYKYILEKVSFDPQLFVKEYKKAACTIDENERQQLIKWMKEKGLSAKMISAEVFDHEFR